VPVKRRPERVVITAPRRLQRFVPVEWAVPPLKEHATAWEMEHWEQVGPVVAWIEARRI
jgi:hypothetical protein